MPKSVTLTKAHIVDSLIEANVFTRREAVKSIETLLELIKSTIESGEGALISSFGRFCVKKIAERRGRNPATGKNMTRHVKGARNIRCNLSIAACRIKRIWGCGG